MLKFPKIKKVDKMETYIDYSYKRTSHFSISPEIHSDDKKLKKKIENNILEVEVVLTEKLDGGTGRLNDCKVFARSDIGETFCGSFSKLKRLYNKILYSNIDFDFDRYIIYGENVQAIHSIIYEKLDQPFYVFHILDKVENEFLSWDEVKEMSIKLGFKHVPEIGTFKFKSVKEMEKLITKIMSEGSYYGGNMEGVVIRKKGRIKYDEFEDSIGKIVRKGHVQTSKHWKIDWKPQKIIGWGE